MKPELSTSPEMLSQCDAWILLMAFSTSLCACAKPGRVDAASATMKARLTDLFSMDTSLLSWRWKFEIRNSRHAPTLSHELVEGLAVTAGAAIARLAPEHAGDAILQHAPIARRRAIILVRLPVERS